MTIKKNSKNMDYEKKYNEALKDMRAIYPHLNGAAKLAVEHAFPELRESEDEKMLNQLHSWMDEFGGAEDYTERVYQWIKGLIEKQKERAAIPDELVKHYKEFCEKSGNDGMMLIDVLNACQKQKEQKPADLPPGFYFIDLDGKKYYSKEFRFEDMKMKIVEDKSEKPAEWSEEDEHRITDAIYFLESAKIHYADTSEIEKTIDFLKSLRPSWKPGEEQLVTLLRAEGIVRVHDTKELAADLAQLYEQLKKLM